jgi:hypothetical protein
VPNLDKVLDALRNDERAKRAKKRAQLDIDVYFHEGEYTVQINGRVTDCGEGDRDAAIAAANRRGEASGKTFNVKVYDV